MLFEFDLSDDDVTGNIQPDGTIMIRIPLSDLQYQNAKNVYVTRTENGRAIQVPAEIEDGYLIIKADHFSPYEIIFNKESDKVIAGHSITLRGDIGVNFYIDLPEDCDAEQTEIEFDWGNKHTDVPLSQIVPDSNTGYYVIPCNVASCEMTDTISATVKCNGEVVASEQYSVEQYAKRLIENNNGEFDNLFPDKPGKLETLRSLVRSMLIYGAKSQIEFDYNTDTLADRSLGDYTPDSVDALSLTSYTYENSDFADFGLNFEGSKLKLKSKTCYMMCFSKTDENIDLPQVVLSDGTVIEPFIEDDYLCYEVTDIPANCVTDDITLYFNGTEKIFNAGSYISRALNSTDQELVDTVTALYGYSQCAKAYFGS
jgi:hypothetical protein